MKVSQDKDRKQKRQMWMWSRTHVFWQSLDCPLPRTIQMLSNYIYIFCRESSEWSSKEFARLFDLISSLVNLYWRVFIFAWFQFTRYMAQTILWTSTPWIFWIWLMSDFFLTVLQTIQTYSFSMTPHHMANCPCGISGILCTCAGPRTAMRHLVKQGNNEPCGQVRTTSLDTVQ